MESSDNNMSSLVARGRLAVISAHLSAPIAKRSDSFLEASPVSAVQSSVPPPGNLKGALTIVDERTGNKYQLQVSDEGTIRATDFKKVINWFNFLHLLGLLFDFC